MLPEASPSPLAAEGPAKKIRQWDAWTQKEEEKFFLALKQVGKNFEGITSLVESKNKNQVRHYYYRLIKRMNKFLNPELSLDARNSKDVTTAMLCWWSLLEKHRCSYSKLHLKPRRLKAFVTSFEQLLRKKSKKKPGDSPDLAEVPTEATTATVKEVSKTELNSSQETASDLPGKLERSERNSDNTSVEPARTSPDGAEPLLVQTASAEMIQKPPSLEGAPTSTSKYKLQLFPLDESVKTTLEQGGHNPHLELTLKGTKSINSVIHHLWQKWGTSTAAVGELRLFPYSPNASTTSWGSADAGLCAADVHAAVGSPAVFRLKYGWVTPHKPEGDDESVQAASSPPREPMEDDACRPEPSEAQPSGCGWLYERSSDGFGQRLWRDEDQQLLPASNDVSGGVDWMHALTVNVSQLLGTSSRDRLRVATHQFASVEPSSSELIPTSTAGVPLWGEDTCDAFSFKRKEEQPCSAEAASQGADNPGEMLRSSSLDLYWADSLGALDGAFGGLPGQTLLLSGNSSLGPGISSCLFPDSLDGFPSKQKT